MYLSINDSKITSMTYMNKPPSCLLALAFEGSDKTLPTVKIFYNF